MTLVSHVYFILLSSNTLKTVYYYLSAIYECDIDLQHFIRNIIIGHVKNVFKASIISPGTPICRRHESTNE